MQDLVTEMQDSVSQCGLLKDDGLIAV